MRVIKACGIAVGISLSLSVNGLEAQHFESELDGGATERSGCGVCHGAHDPQGSSRANLRLGGADMMRGPSLAAGVELDDTSLSCLRCHGTRSLRDRQPEFARTGSGGRGKFLNLDFSDDHPIGRLSDRVPLFDASSADPLNAAVIGATTSGPTDEMSCVLCHLPHAAEGIQLSVERQSVLCSGCHSAVVFAGSGSHGSLACTDCHKLHMGRSRALIRQADTNTLCKGCHEVGAQSLSGSEFSAAAANPPIGHVTAPSEDCVSCHETH